MKKLLISISLLASATAFAKNTQTSSSTASTSSKTSFHVNKVLIQGGFGLSAISGDDFDLQGSSWSLKGLVSPYDFSFAKLVVGGGLEMEDLKRGYKRTGFLDTSAKAEVSTDYLVFNAGLVFQPWSYLKIIPMLEYAYGFSSTETTTVRNDLTGDTLSKDKDISTDRFGITTEALFNVAKNIDLGLTLGLARQSIDDTDFTNVNLGLMASYTLNF